MNKARWSLTLAMLLMTAAFSQAKGPRNKADEALPDSAFASVERGPKGEKVRHLPYRDAAGQVDAKRLRVALRMWKRVKWVNQADAGPALTVLKQAQGPAKHAKKKRTKKA